MYGSEGRTRRQRHVLTRLKMNIGADSQTKLIYAVVVAPAKVHDKHALPDLLHGQERRVYGMRATLDKST